MLYFLLYPIAPQLYRSLVSLLLALHDLEYLTSFFSSAPLLQSSSFSLFLPSSIPLSNSCYLSLSFCLSSLFIPLFVCRPAMTNVHLPKDPLWFLNQPPHEYTTKWLSASYEGTLLWMQITANTPSK